MAGKKYCPEIWDRIFPTGVFPGRSSTGWWRPVAEKCDWVAMLVGVGVQMMLRNARVAITASDIFNHESVWIKEAFTLFVHHCLNLVP